METIVKIPVKVRPLLKEFVAVSNEKYGSNSYAAGFFEAMLSNIIDEMPAAKQEYWVSMIAEQLEKNKEL